MSEWAPQHVVDAARAARLVGRQFPALRGGGVQPYAEGWDNTVHLVDERWLFRFPRREIALPGVRREIAVLPRLAPSLPLPVPVPELVAEPDEAEGYPWPFWGAALLPGTELADAGLADVDRVAAAAGLGAFLQALHAPSLAAELGAALPVDPMGRADMAVRVPRTRASLDALVAAGLWQPEPAAGDLLARAADLPPAVGTPVLAHGDLHARHLLVDEAGAAAGVIDWGDLCRGCRSIDLMLVYSGFAGAARTVFLDAYGAVEADTELRARVLALNLSAVLAAYAADQHRPALLAEALGGLRRALR